MKDAPKYSVCFTDLAEFLGFKNEVAAKVQSVLDQDLEESIISTNQGQKHRSAAMFQDLSINEEDESTEERKSQEERCYKNLPNHLSQSEDCDIDNDDDDDDDDERNEEQKLTGDDENKKIIKTSV